MNVSQTSDDIDLDLTMSPLVENDEDQFPSLSAATGLTKKNADQSAKSTHPPPKMKSFSDVTKANSTSFPTNTPSPSSTHIKSDHVDEDYRFSQTSMSLMPPPYPNHFSSLTWHAPSAPAPTSFVSLRHQVADLAHKRNMLLNQVTEAYLVGNRSLAKQMSMDANQLNVQMHQLQSQAAQEAYMSHRSLVRSPSTGVASPTTPVDFADAPHLLDLQRTYLM